MSSITNINVFWNDERNYIYESAHRHAYVHIAMYPALRAQVRANIHASYEHEEVLCESR